MGEARYYLKARWPSEDDLTKALPEVRALVEEVAQAYDWWQDHRNLPRSKFWPDFRQKFPRTTVYLGDLAGKGCNNELSGELDLVDPNASSAEFGQTGATFGYDAEVWHMASWDRFADALKRLGAVRVEWTSDEFASPYESLHV